MQDATPTPEEKELDVLTFQLRAEEKERIRRTAERKHLTMSAYCRLVLLADVDAYEKQNA